MTMKRPKISVKSVVFFTGNEDLLQKSCHCLRKFVILCQLSHMTHLLTQEFKAHGDHLCWGLRYLFLLLFLSVQVW